ncbi:MAG: hypothetical protein RIT81_44650 [Deltaproteobacteria bacterium]
MTGSIRPLTLAWVFVAACATTSPPDASRPSSTTVEATPPTRAPTPEEVFTQMVHDHVQRRSAAVEQCYLSEVLSGAGSGLADFDLAVRARPGTRQPIVRVVRASRPGQQLLASCITQALTAVPFDRERFDVVVVPVKILAPDWLAAR